MVCEITGQHDRDAWPHQCLYAHDSMWQKPSLTHGTVTATGEMGAPEGIMHGLAPLMEHRAFVESAALVLDGSIALS